MKIGKFEVEISDDLKSTLENLKILLISITAVIVYFIISFVVGFFIDCSFFKATSSFLDCYNKIGYVDIISYIGSGAFIGFAFIFVSLKVADIFSYLKENIKIVKRG